MGYNLCLYLPIVLLSGNAKKKLHKLKAHEKPNRVILFPFAVT